MYEKILSLYCPLNPSRIVEFRPTYAKTIDGGTVALPLNICDQSPGLNTICDDCRAAVTLYAHYHPNFCLPKPVFLSDIQEDIPNTQD